MRSRLLLFASILAALSGDCQASLDLTSVAREYVSEGINYRELIFNDGDRKVSVELPNKWQFRCSPEKIGFTVPDNHFVAASIEGFANPGKREFDEQTVKALLQKVQADLPADVTQVTVESRPNPVMLDGHETFEVLVSYTLMGTAFQRSTVFVNLPETQVVFRLSARKEEFDSTNKVFRRLILSWHWSDNNTNQIR
jgi:hypothetical protein